MIENIKEKSVAGVLWVGFQKGGGLSVSFIANLILARLLSPEDYGCIGMLTIFIAVAQTFIDGGFGAALIQKKQPSEQEYSTIFYFNIFIALFCYAILFYSAPFIADFYHIPLLCDVLRVQGIILFLNSFCLIQTSRLLKQLNFKTLSIVSIASVLGGSLLGVFFAYQGYGVWSLVIKELFSAFVSVMALWFLCKWRPLLSFKFRLLKGLFRYGSMILLSSIVFQIYENFQGLIIGRSFSAANLGYYTQAKKIENVPSSVFYEIIQKVTFPILSLMSDDLSLLKGNVRKNIKVLNYVVFAIMALLYLIAEPLFFILFTDKWSLSVPFFRILCLAAILGPLNNVTTQIFKAVGRSDILFVLQFVRRIIGITIILFFIRWGLMAMMWALVINAYAFYLLNMIFTSRCLNYTFKEQIGDVLPNLSLCLGVIVLGNFISFNSYSAIIQILLMTLTFVLFYITVSWILRLEGGSIIYKIVKDKFT